MGYYEKVLTAATQALAPRSGLERLPRRERERLTRRQDIIDAGRHVFAVKGYHAATLDDVAVAAELGKATLYSYFNGKELLFESVVEDSFATMKAIGEHVLRGPGTFEERIRLFIATELDYFFRNPSSLKLMMSEAHQLRRRNPMLHLMPQLLYIISDSIAAEQANGTMLAEANPLDLATMLINMMYGQFMARIYRAVHAQIATEQHSRLEQPVSTERLVEASHNVSPETIEAEVLAITNLVFTVFVGGTRGRSS
ncbi:MAG: TetR/AcrR family transcriptional regulator [Bacteroidetes bacterium]|nr:TetR/AcrR family transcriptional regulator [Bacteroidota bacterium]